MNTCLIQAVRAGALAVVLASAGCSSGGGGASSPLTIGVSVAGLNPGRTLVLQNNGGDSLTVSANGTHRFGTPVVNGAAYAVTIATQPAGQTCFVTNGSGTVADASVTGITVACPHFVYVANKDSGDISAYRIDLLSGALAGVAGSPFAAGVGPAFVAIHPGGRHAYFANRGSRDISVFGIDAASGALTPIGTIAAAAGRAPVAIAFAPGGLRIYVAERDIGASGLSDAPGSGSIVTHDIDSATGMPVSNPGAPVLAGLAANAIALDPTGSYAYVAEGVLFAGSIRAYGVDAASGALTEIVGSTRYAPAASSVALTPDGRFAYAASTSVSLHGYDPTVGLLHAFAIDSATGALAAVGDAPLAFGDGFPGPLALGADGRFVYVGDFSGRIHVFAVDAAVGAPSPVAGSPFAAGSAHAGIALDPGGRFAYVADRAGGLAAYAVNATTGALSPVAGGNYATGVAPAAVAVR
jgi:6-phosphogluconolactonase (cycloisomerase 2 family)